MKRWLLVMMAVLFLAGCTGARESGYYEHKSHYQSWDHMKFSLWGYKSVSPAEAQKSQAEGWWGIPVEGTKR